MLKVVEKTWNEFWADFSTCQARTYNTPKGFGGASAINSWHCPPC